jgi:hypothetical protein
MLNRDLISQLLPNKRANLAHGSLGFVFELSKGLKKEIVYEFPYDIFISGLLTSEQINNQKESLEFTKNNLEKNLNNADEKNKLLIENEIINISEKINSIKTTRFFYPKTEFDIINEKDYKNKIFSLIDPLIQKALNLILEEETIKGIFSQKNIHTENTITLYAMQPQTIKNALEKVLSNIEEKSQLTLTQFSLNIISNYNVCEHCPVWLYGYWLQNSDFRSVILKYFQNSDFLIGKDFNILFDISSVFQSGKPVFNKTLN